MKTYGKGSIGIHYVLEYRHQDGKAKRERGKRSVSCSIDLLVKDTHYPKPNRANPTCTGKRYT